MDYRFGTLYNSFKEISLKIHNSSQNELNSTSQTLNSSNDKVSNLDIWANNTIENALCSIPKMYGYISEEKNLPVFFKNRDLSNYNLFCFIDPLDGSKNIDINGVVGSIYTIVRYDPCKDEIGTIIEAGYVMYGAKTLLVIGNDSSNNSLNIFELNQNHIWVKYSTINSFKTRKHELPTNKTYFMNEGYSLNFEPKIRDLLSELKEDGFSQRWSGSMIMDCHHLFMKGGIFAYPGNKLNPNGKLRYLYEVLPFSYLTEILGGYSLLGLSRFEPNLIHNGIKLKTAEEIHQSVEITLVSPDFKNYLKLFLTE